MVQCAGTMRRRLEDQEAVMLHARFRYRPLKVGWCVRPGVLDDLRSVLRLTHALWGGAFNPVIPIDATDLAADLVRVFRVDVLYPAVNDDASLTAFIDRFPYLGWPDYERRLFSVGDSGPPLPTLVDLLSISEYCSRIKEPLHGALYEWDATDPLADVLLATLGELPRQEECGSDYRGLFLRRSAMPRKMIDQDVALEFGANSPSSVNDLTTYLLDVDTVPPDSPGLYIGDSQSFDDLVSYWNLRAAGNSLLFFDPAHAARFGPPTTAHLERVRSRHRGAEPWRNMVTLWSMTDRPERPPGDLGPEVALSKISPYLWNGLNQHPPLMRCEGRWLALPTEMNEERPSIVVPLDNKPFSREFPFGWQKLVASIDVTMRLQEGKASFRVPYLPQLNEWLGRASVSNPDRVRVEREGVGIVVQAHDEHVWATAVPTAEIIGRVFRTYGLEVEPSLPGLVATRLIAQMGGYQGCRVFKVRGVRELIRQYRPDESFTRQQAERVIGDVDPGTQRPRFEKYERLFIEPRRTPKLTPKDVFGHLLRKGVFRVGQELKCSNCHLEFWRALDELRSVTPCELCGESFSIVEQLRDRYWRYRRSGLFGRADNQHGAIPVALALQQLHTFFSMRSVGGDVFLAGTCMTVKPAVSGGSNCEIDLVLVTQEQLGWECYPVVLIGECKSDGQPITSDDARNLAGIADRYPRDLVKVFVLFAKTAPFSEADVEACALAQDQYEARVILLSDRELEPYFIFQRTADEVSGLGRLEHPHSLRELAVAMVQIYPALRPQRWPPEPTAPTEWKPADG